MYHFSRIWLALIVFLAGAALVPLVGLPAETFEWQRYAGAYEEPILVVNYSDGQPGSYFHVSGTGFHSGNSLFPNATVTVSANGHVLGTTSTSNSGDLEFNLSTTDADVGSYYIAVEDGTATQTVRIVLSNDAPLRPLEGTGDTLNIPAGIGVTELFLPVIKR